MLRRLFAAAVLVALVGSTPAGAYFAEKHIVDITTDGSGNATGFTPYVTGGVLTIVYVKDGTTPFTDGVDFTITLENTGLNCWTEANVNASKTVHVRVAAATAAGAASTLTEVPISAANERVKIAIAQGGAAKLGRFFVIVGG